MSRNHFVDINYVMTGETEKSVPIHLLPFEGPYGTNQTKADGSAIIVGNTRELERLAAEKFGSKITIYME